MKINWAELAPLTEGLPTWQREDIMRRAANAVEDYLEQDFAAGIVAVEKHWEIGMWEGTYDLVLAGHRIIDWKTNLYRPGLGWQTRIYSHFYFLEYGVVPTFELRDLNSREFVKIYHSNLLETEHMIQWAENEYRRIKGEMFASRNMPSACRDCPFADDCAHDRVKPNDLPPRLRQSGLSVLLECQEKYRRGGWRFSNGYMKQGAAQHRVLEAIWRKAMEER